MNYREQAPPGGRRQPSGPRPANPPLLWWPTWVGLLALVLLLGRHAHHREHVGTGTDQCQPTKPPKISQPSFTTKAVGEGTGLGLSLGHDIITTGLGSTPTLESHEGQGTKFGVTLPA